MMQALLAANEFGKKARVESVENEKTAKILVEIDVVYGQDYYYGQPFALAVSL